MNEQLGLGGDTFFTLTELAALLGIRRDTLEKYVKLARLKGIKKGQTRFFTLSAVEAARVRVPFKAPARPDAA